jgi:hypothetical protein
LIVPLLDCLFVWLVALAPSISACLPPRVPRKLVVIQDGEGLPEGE